VTISSACTSERIEKVRRPRAGEVYFDVLREERLGYQASPCADMIRDLHANRGLTQVKQVARAQLGDAQCTEPIHPYQMDPAERARAISRAQIAAMFSAESSANKLEADVDVRKEEVTSPAPAIRRTAFDDTWLPGRAGEQRERERLAKRFREGR
jgi:hypothetical protein